MQGKRLIALGTLVVVLGQLEGGAAPRRTEQLSIGANALKHEPTEWCDIWITNADKDDLPRVLLIGDSITRAYFKDVERHLAGKANCARVTTSKCISDPGFLLEVELMLTQYRFKVIHVNNGLHGWSYSEDQYGKAFGPFLQTLKRDASEASLIWAQTTPVMVDGNPVNERTERVKARNTIAATFASEYHIPINDLFGLVVRHPEWYSTDGVHFNQQGIDVQAKQVANSILRALDDSSRSTDRPMAKVVQLDLSLENGAKAPVKIIIQDKSIVREASPGQIDLDLSSLANGDYVVYFESPGYASQLVRITLPNAVGSGLRLQIRLFRERYVVMRYAFNKTGGRRLAGGDVQEGRVAVAHWGSMEFFGQDWQVWQSGDQGVAYGTIPSLNFHRITTGFGLLKLPMGRSFDALKEAPETGYQCENIKAVKGTVLVCRIAGNWPKDHGFGKIVIEGVTETPPPGLSVIRPRTRSVAPPAPRPRS